MGLTNYERQKRWREKHPALANLRRREHYKRAKGHAKDEPASVLTTAADRPQSKIEELRALIAAESAKPVQSVAITETKPRVFKNDFGAVITESQWNELQKRKAAAANAGYVIDEYSQ